jgi:hypothetical protein
LLQHRAAAKQISIYSSCSTIAEHHEQIPVAIAFCTMHTTTSRSSSLEICCKYEQDLKKYDPDFKK